MHARIHRSVKVYVVWSIVLLASPYLDAQSAVPELSVQLKAEGYSPESCISSPPSAYVTGDTTVHINVVNDLQVELQPAYLDLDGRLRLLKKRQANSSWNDSTYAQTIWVWLDDTNKKCLGTTQIGDVATQSKIIRLSELSHQQIDAITERTKKDSSVGTITSESPSKPKNLSVAERERAALVGFYAATDGPAWKKSDGWLTDTNHCEWHGITCERGRVTGLELNSNGAYGEIPSVVGQLRQLKRLFLHSNNFIGDLPPEIGNLLNLTHLHLGYNALSGSLPSSMSRLRNLQYLYLNDNQLSGPLPRWLASSRIWALGIGNNSFWGDLRALNGISRLVYFTAYNNQLAGPLPDFVANWKRLRRFDVSGNSFSGEFPATVAHHLASVDEVKISGNKFKCPVPFVIRDALAAGKEFCVGFTLQDNYDGWLEGEYARGSDPYSTSQLAYKSYFEKGLREGMHQRWHPNGELMHQAEYSAGEKDGIWRWWDENGLQTQEKTYRQGRLHGIYRTFKKGKVDKEYCYQNGKSVSLSSCEPTFEAPPSDEEIREKERGALVALFASTNGRDWKENEGWLSDTNHCAWFGVTCEDHRVSRLELPDNRLQGFIPDELGDLHRLKWLTLGQNELTGDFPKAVRRLVSLEVMSLNNNQFIGEIPEWLGEISLLRWLSISQNQFSGTLPESIGDLSRLRVLYASDNNLEGGIPLWADRIYNLSLARNQLSGAISKSLALRLLDSHQYQYSFNGNDFPCPFPAEIADIFAQKGEFCVEGQKSESYNGELSANYESGQTAIIGNFEDGKRSGRYQRWYENGNLRIETYYERGKRSGLYRYYNEDGSLKTEGSYVSDRKHGFQIQYKSDGEIKSKECFIRGKKTDSEECETLKIASASHSENRPERSKDSTDSKVTTTVNYPPERKEERDALIALYNSTNGPSWVRRDGWLSEDDYCSWVGVRCVDGRVRNLSLSKNNLSGTLPEEIGNLTKIFSLNLSGQKLTGRIPESIERISSGTNIDLSGNDFECPFPQVITGDLAYYGNEFCEQDKRVDDFSGVLEGFYSNGNKRHIGIFSNGEFDGPFRAWFRDGQPWVVYHYKDGSKHGVQRVWASNGQPVSKVSYREGLVDGFYLTYKNGKVAGKSCYVLNKKVEGFACIEGDTDLDGVANHEDKCPKTHSTATSDTTGCSQPQLDKSLVATGTKSSQDHRDIEDRHSTASTPEQNAAFEPTPAPVRTPSGNRQAPNSGEKLALVVHELNSARRMYNDQYELTEVRMDYENQELNYLFSVRDSVSELDVSMLAMVAKSTYCTASKLELFREENIPAVWIYADSSGEELRIPTWTVDCK